MEYSLFFLPFFDKLSGTCSCMYEVVENLMSFYVIKKAVKFYKMIKLLTSKLLSMHLFLC